MKLDDYYKSMYDGGTVTLSVGEEIAFSSNQYKSIPSKTYTLVLESVKEDVAILRINGTEQPVERGFDYSYGLIRFIGIGYGEDKLVLAIGSGV